MTLKSFIYRKSSGFTNYSWGAARRMLWDYLVVCTLNCQKLYDNDNNWHLLMQICTDSDRSNGVELSASNNTVKCK